MEPPMPVIRLIYCRVPAEECEKAVQNWKDYCAPLMIQQPGCMSEKLLRRTDGPGEFISYSEWDSDDSIRKYLDSDAHKEIKRHNRNIAGAEVNVCHYAIMK
jgi:heme-degrading monooxygenase HmoA